jgi:hypothetical protein
MAVHCGSIDKLVTKECLLIKCDHNNESTEDRYQETGIIKDKVGGPEDDWTNTHYCLLMLRTYFPFFDEMNCKCYWYVRKCNTNK